MRRLKTLLIKAFPRLPFIVQDVIQETLAVIVLFYYRLQMNSCKKGNKTPIAFCLYNPVDIHNLKDIIAEIRRRDHFGIFLFCFFDHRKLPAIEAEHVLIRHNFTRVIKYMPFRMAITCESGVKTRLHSSTFFLHLIHSMASAHIVYPEGSFDHYDFIFCAGPHHSAEFAQLLKGKNKRFYLVKAGYPVIDSIYKENSNVKGSPVIVYAPTWGKNNSLVLYGRRLIEQLINDYQVVLRPHPLNFIYDQSSINDITDALGNHPNFSIDAGSSSMNILKKADLLISDYSGIALEFALSREQPVLYLNSEVKILNSNWKRYLDNSGAHVEYREQTGAVLHDVNEAKQIVQYLLSGSKKAEIIAVRSKLLYNFLESASYMHEVLLLIEKGSFETFECIGN